MIHSKLSQASSPPGAVVQLGMPVRKSRTPPGVPYSYSDTFEEDVSGKSSSQQLTKSLESDGDDSYSDTFLDGSATEKIETHISENISVEKFNSSTHLPEYSEDFEPTTLSDGKTSRRYSTSDSVSNTYSDYSYTRSRSDSLSNVSMATETEAKEDLDTTYNYTSFEDSVSGRRSFTSSRGDEGMLSYDYSYTFEATDDLDDTEKLKREAEIEALSKEAQEKFTSAMLSNIKQKRFKESDVTFLLESDKQQKTEDIDKHAAKFLKKKLHLLKYKNKHGISKPNINPTSLTGSPPKLRDYGINPEIIQKLKLKNFMKEMENAANAEIHDVRTCKDCRRHKRQIEEVTAKRNFIREKTRTVRQQMVEDRLDKHLVQMSSISLIGDLAKSLPRLGDDPEVVMEKLNKGLALSKSLSNTWIRKEGDL